MNWLTLRRSPKQVRDDLTSDHELHPADNLDPDDEPPTVQWTGGTALATRAASIGLIFCLACGPAAVAVATYLWVNAPTSVAALAPTPDLTGEQTKAQEFAQRIVLAWLTTRRGDETSLRGLLPAGYVAPTVAFRTSELAVADITRTAPGVWSVTVGATVTDTDKRQTRLYAQVPVQTDGHGWSAVTLPAVVPGPELQPGQPAQYRQPMSSSGPLGATVAEFLAALLTGTGDVSRYVAPEQTIQPLTPAPFTTVQVTKLDAETAVDETQLPHDGIETQLVAVATASTPTGQQLMLAYALTVRARDGRWEIVTIDPAPATRSASTSGSATATASPPLNSPSTPTR